MAKIRLEIIFPDYTKSDLLLLAGSEHCGAFDVLSMFIYTDFVPNRSTFEVDEVLDDEGDGIG
jgi:hypothetical protein